ncbi:BnaUnng00620D [Brassica napus]|uniref:BnaUnng00620D protein n=1 Tax=Brassica napus TaxID=3708 RepID=A0A078J588_BRANA|nr:BnaUnng00620D [Brassica napus]
MGQDYSYSQPSSSDEYDITSLIQAEAELYGDEAESNYHIAEPLQYQPQPECDEGIPRICYCGGDPVVAISSTAKDPGRRYFTCPNVDDGDCHIWKWWDVAITEEMREFQTQLRQLKDQVCLVWRSCICLEELQRSKSECLKPRECPYNKCAYLRICIAVRVTHNTSLTMDKNTSYVNLLFTQSQSSVDLDSPEPF